MLILEDRKFWNDLLFAMSEGDISSYNELQSVDILDFWALYENWVNKKKNK